jgi:hypothetical protein
MSEIDWERVRMELADTIHSAREENITLIHYNSDTGESWRITPNGTVSSYDIDAEREEFENVKGLTEIMQAKFVVCTYNQAFEDGLTLHRVYKVLSYDDEGGWVRIVDDTGEEDLYAPNYFIPVRIPEEAEHYFDIA